jgi:hypothetical protein
MSYWPANDPFRPPQTEGNTVFMLRFLGRLRNFARVRGPAVLLPHYPRKLTREGVVTARGA